MTTFLNSEITMIDYLDLQKVNAAHGDEISEAVQRVVKSGRYLQGTENAAFEREYAEFTGTRFAIGCGNGLDALKLILRAYIECGRLNPGDEVIVPANTYIASILAVSECGLIPVLVEPDSATLQLDYKEAERAVSPRTKAMMIVHLYGRCAYNEDIAAVCKANGLLLIEDNAQAHGCKYSGRRTGSLGDAAAHSFYPGKNLGALGDGGAVTTNDSRLADMVRALGNYGSVRKYVFDYIGMNSRLDEIQASVLRAKLPHLDADNSARKVIARRYLDEIKNPLIELPVVEDFDAHVFHVFTVFSDRRDDLQKYLAGNGVQTLIHYPIPPHHQKCYPQWNSMKFPITEKIHLRELSLPMSPVMNESDVTKVIELVNSWK